MRLPIEGCLFALLMLVGAERTQCQQSPIQKGSIQIAGTASVTHTRDIGNDFGWTAVEVLPRVAYFVARGVAVSGNFRFRRIWYDDQPTIRDQRALDWGFGPGLTYYAATPFRRLFPFVSARTLFLRGTSHSYVTRSDGEERLESRSTNNVWLLSGGALYMVGKHVGITGELFYQHENFSARYAPSPESANSSETYGLQWGVAAFIF